MRWKTLAAIAIALAWLAPAVPATASEPAQIGLDQACRLGQPVTYPDLRPLLDVDVDAMTDTDVRVRVNQILAQTKGIYIQVPQRAQEALDGKYEGAEKDTREFLKSRARIVWDTDMRVLVNQVMHVGGAHVKEAAGKVLDAATTDNALAFLNEGQHTARTQDYRDLATEAKRTGGPEVVKAATAALDGTFEDLRVFLCSGWRAAHDKDQAAASPSPSATPTPKATPTPSSTPTPTTTGGPALPVTGPNTMALLIVGMSLIACGAAGVVIARRVRA
ncbi:ALF repeat-containing protein [Catellatospora vulcania]|uniref:ALF repeat-containing protein n=1 Tax=Catellatospora vulcania TaxID=1460450 RepID=UPI0012D3F816|nr:ALF repeat-containing protein [Catellatospora vulcania]